MLVTYPGLAGGERLDSLGDAEGPVQLICVNAIYQLAYFSGFAQSKVRNFHGPTDWNYSFSI